MDQDEMPIGQQPTELSANKRPRAMETPDPDPESLFLPEREERQETPPAPAKAAKRPKLESPSLPNEPFPDEQDRIASSTASISLPDNCPRLAAYHPLREQTEKDIGELLKDFATVYDQLKASGYSNADIENMVKQQTKYWDVTQHYPRTKPVALLGQMGAGKSRTINCLLDQDGAALDSDKTTRGTNIVHEYTGPEAGQLEKYRIEAVYYSAGQLKDRVTKSVKAIYGYLDLKNGSTELEDDDEEDVKTRFNTAVNFYRTILCGRKEFQDQDEAETFFVDHFEKPTKAETLCSILEKMLNTFKASRNVVDNIETLHASDEAQLNEVFTKVSKPLDSREYKQPHPWPLVRKVQVRLRDSPLLKSGAIVSDTPGLADSDELVVHGTTMYLEDAGMLLVVSPLLRTSDMGPLNETLKMCMRLGKAESTYLVMTKIDHKDELKDRDRQNLEPSFLNRIEAAEVEKTRLANELQELEARKNELMPKLGDPSALAEFQEVYNHCSQVPLLVAKQDNLIFQLTVQARNHETEQMLKRKFRDLSRSTKAPDLKSIFISNEEYQNIAKGKPAKLDRDATGIPTLQRLIFEVPATDKFGTLKHICISIVPASLRGVIGSLTQTKLERKAEVERTMTLVFDQSSEMVNSLQRTLDRLFKDLIEGTFSKCEDGWRRDAEDLARNWQKIHASTFWSFCRRSGEWRPKKGEKMICWNSLIQNIMIDDVSEAFDTFWDGVDEAKTAIENRITTWFAHLENSLKACPGFQGVSLTQDGEMFYASLRDGRDKTITNATKAVESLRRQVRDIYNDIIINVPTEENYIDTAMQPTYDAGKQIKAANYSGGNGKRRDKKKKGNGAHKERVDMVRNKLMGAGHAPEAIEEDTKAGKDSDDEDEAQLSVFQSVFEQAKADFYDRLGNFTTRIKGHLEGTSSEIMADFHRRYSVKEEDASKDPEAKEALLDAARKTLAALEGRVKHQLEECERWEKEGDKVVLS